MNISILKLDKYIFTLIQPERSYLLTANNNLRTCPESNGETRNKNSKAENFADLENEQNDIK